MDKMKKKIFIGVERTQIKVRESLRVNFNKSSVSVNDT
jgi:hypothetical protein